MVFSKELIDSANKQILLIAPDLLGESLAHQLMSQDSNLTVFLDENELSKHPSLVIWSIESTEIPNGILIESKLLKEKWCPSPPVSYTHLRAHET